MLIRRSVNTCKQTRRFAVVALMATLMLVACGGDDDNGDGGNGDNGDGGSSGSDGGASVPAEDGTAPAVPDLSQELASTVSEDGNLELVVNGVHQDGDVVTVWATLTNVGDEFYNAGDLMTDPTLARLDQVQARDTSGVYLIDWNARKAYYPMFSEEGTCLCSRIGQVDVEPGDSASIFVMYNGVGELDEATLVVPTFLPADGLSPS